MAELKTKENNLSVSEFLEGVADAQMRADSKVLVKLFKEITGQPAKMWGSSMVGFGKYHYKSERSAQEGDWPMSAFSPRKNALTVYVMPGTRNYAPQLKKLGKHKVSGGSCIYIKKLSDIDIKILEEIISKSYSEMKKKYPAK